MQETEKNVFTQVQSDRFHTSRPCAGDMMALTECTIREAVKAQRRPCRNCCGEAEHDAYHAVLDEITGR